MARRWMFGLVTFIVMAGLIGLVAYSGETRHRQRALHRTEVGHQVTPDAPTARPAVPEPEMGPTYQGNGLMLTY
jgi:hypothetical protein